VIDATGLRPTSEGWRIRYSGEQRTVVEGPFAPARDQIAGYTIIRVSSREEAMGWAMRYPKPALEGEDAEIEIRQLFELEDFVQGPAVLASASSGSSTGSPSTSSERAPISPPRRPPTARSRPVHGHRGIHTAYGTLGRPRVDAPTPRAQRDRREQAKRHSGVEVKSQGDGFMLAFASARNAVRCAMGIQLALAERDSSGPELRVRIGLHTGEPVREAEDFYGKAVILAARIAGEARGSEILVSSLVRELTESTGEFSFEAATDAELKGLSGMHRLSAVRWRG
jgi:hypothetical protein